MSDKKREELADEELENAAGGSGSGLPTGKRQHQPFTLTKAIDSSGSSAGEATITSSSGEGMVKL